MKSKLEDRAGTTGTAKVGVLDPGQEVDAWRRSHAPVNAEPEHFHLVCRLRPQVIRPYVLQVRGESIGAEDLVLVGRLEKHRCDARLGYIHLPGPQVTAWVGVHGGWLGQPTEPQILAAIDHLLVLLKRREVDIAVFHGMRRGAKTTEVLQNWAARWRLWYRTAWTQHYILHIPEDPEFLWKRLRAKHRSWLRGREKRLRDQFTGNLEWHWHREFPELEKLMARLETVASRTYQRRLGAGFRNDEEHQARFRLFARQGILRVQTLEAAGRVLAFWVGELANGVFYSAETGYDPVFREYELGTLVFMRLTENLVHERARLLDFGLGEADYKRRFADDSYEESDMYIFGRSAPGLVAACLIGGLGRLHTAAKSWVARLGALNRIRTAWRRRLQG